jgi:hypothetical protein
LRGADRFKDLADDVGSSFGGTKASVETCKFIGAEGEDTNFRIRARECLLIFTGGASCNVCSSYAGNLRAQLSNHGAGGGRDRKIDPNSRAHTNLIGEALLRDRLDAEHKLRMQAEKREAALAKRIEDIKYVQVEAQQAEAFADLVKAACDGQGRAVQVETLPLRCHV